MDVNAPLFPLSIYRSPTITTAWPWVVPIIPL